MTPIKVILVEDEKRVRRSLINVLKLHCPEITVVAEAEDVSSGIEAIKANAPDIVLMDIQMPDGTGFDILNHLKPLTFKVIFITAFDQHAVHAFKFSAIDYLLKPVVPQELVNALKRAEGQLVAENSNTKLDVFMNNMSELAYERKKIVLNSQEKMHVVSIKDIVSCEADGNYVKFHLLENKEIMVSRPLKEFDEMLSPFGFFRSHHSHLVNLSLIDRVEKNDGTIIMKDGSAVLISARRNADLAAALNRI